MSLLNKIVNLINSGDKRAITAKKNVIGALLVKGISIITQLLLVPITLDYVSSEVYGIWLTLSSVILWISFFDVGLSLGLKNKLAESIANNDVVRGKVYVSTTYFMMIAIFIPLCFLIEIIIPYIDWSLLLKINPKYTDDVIIAMRVITICFCFQMVVHVLSSVVSAYQKVALASAIPVIGHVGSLIVIYIFTKLFPPSLFLLSLAISLVPVIAYFFFSLYFFSGAFKEVKPNYKYVNFECIKDLFGLGYKFFIIQIQILVVFQTTNFLISNITGPEMVTSYNIAYKYFSVGMMIFSIIISPYWPAFTDAYTKKDYNWMNNIYKELKKVFLFVAIGLLLMLVLSDKLYYMWVGETAYVPFVMSTLVAVCMILQSWSSLQVQLINGIGALSLQTIITLIGMCIHIPLSYAISYYIGAFGVVISMIFINTLYSVVFTVQMRKLLSKTAKGIWIK